MEQPPFSDGITQAVFLAREEKLINPGRLMHVLNERMSS